MSHLRSLAAGLILAAAALAATSTAAQAAPSYVTGYHAYEGYSDNPSFGSSAFVDFHATDSIGNVWINGTVHCAGYNGAHVTWCGWLNNGGIHAQAGVNYTAFGGSWWYRMDVYAPAEYGQLECVPRGNAGIRVVDVCPGVVG